MSSQSYSHRDTPLRRFNAFWWGLGCFGSFGLISVVVFALSDRAPSVEQINAGNRKPVIDIVESKQADLLADKEVEPGKVKQVSPEKVFDSMSDDLKKSPAASAVPIPGAKVTEGGDPGNGKKVYARNGCAACHGPDGNSPPAAMFPALGGKEPAYLIQKMKDIKSGAYSTPLTAGMMPMIANVSEAEMADIAAWLAGGSK